MPAPLPSPPHPDEPLEAAFGAAVVAALRERTVTAGPGLAVRMGPGGTVVSLASAPRGAGGGAETDTAVADAADTAPQLRSVELREAVPDSAATGGNPASPAALQLHGFDEEAPGASAGGALRLKPAADGAPAGLVLPDGTTEQSEAWTVPLRKVGEDGSRTLVWAKIGADPAPDGGDGEGEGGESAPPCGNPLNRPGGGGATENPLDGGEEADDDDPTPEGAIDDNPLDHPGDGGYTPTCGGDPSAAPI